MSLTHTCPPTYVFTAIQNLQEKLLPDGTPSTHPPLHNSSPLTGVTYGGHPHLSISSSTSSGGMALACHLIPAFKEAPSFREQHLSAPQLPLAPLPTLQQQQSSCPPWTQEYSAELTSPSQTASVGRATSWEHLFGFHSWTRPSLKHLIFSTSSTSFL